MTIAKIIMGLMIMALGFKTTMLLVLGSSLTALMLFMLLVCLACGLISSVSNSFGGAQHG